MSLLAPIAVPCPLWCWFSPEPASPGHPCPSELSLSLPHHNLVRRLESTEEANLIRISIHLFNKDVFCHSVAVPCAVCWRRNSLGRSSWSPDETAM